MGNWGGFPTFTHEETELIEGRRVKKEKGMNGQRGGFWGNYKTAILRIANRENGRRALPGSSLLFLG